MTEHPVEVLEGIQIILARIISLLDGDRIPTLQAAAALLSPVSGLENSNILNPTMTTYLRNHLLDDNNILTSPTEESIRLLHALLVSAFLCGRSGCATGIRQAGELALLQDKEDQDVKFSVLMLAIGNGPKEEDKYWIKKRNEILWLRTWGAEELSDGADVENGKGRGIFGRLPKEFIEAEILKALLANTSKFFKLQYLTNV